jgi:phosphoribosyl-AMP cyclohydrolase
VVKIAINCERNQLLIQVIPLGKGVCHERDEDGMAKSTCFSRTFFEVLI